MTKAAIACTFAACLAVSNAALAADPSGYKARFGPDLSPAAEAMPKAASTRTLGSRATATLSQTVYGGFELAAPATVYILVRGNSLGTLGVTQGYLDYPRVRIFNAAGVDQVFDNAGREGFNGCLSSTDQAVLTYYANRGAPAHADDACIAATFSSGAFTFSVTPTTIGNFPSSPPFGEILFEVTLGP